jgi:hypothetical protein
MKKHMNPIIAGLLQAAGILLYIFVFACTAAMGQHVANFPLVFSIIFPLLIFSFSVLLCSAITLAYPVSLYLSTKKWKDSFLVILWMILWMALFVIALLAFFAAEIQGYIL